MTQAAPYQLRVCDLVTDRNIGIIPVQDVEWDTYIGKTGALSCTAPVPNAGFARRIRERVLPGRTMAYLEQARRIVWGGPIWTRTPTADERGYITCPIQGAGLESVLRGHRQLTVDKTYAAADQLDIVRDLIAWDAGQPGGGLALEVDATTSGVLRDRAYSHYDLPYMGDLLDQLAAVDGGFEWYVQCYSDTAGARHRAVRLGYPKLPVGATPTILSRPGAIYRYSLPEDATRQANTWISRGASINNNLAANSYPLMTAQLSSPALIAAGWPRLDGSSDYSTVSDQATLDGHAAADLARSQMPVAIPSVDILSGAIELPQLGTLVRLRIRDDWFYDGLDAQYRVIGLHGRPAQRGRPDTTTLYLEAA